MGKKYPNGPTKAQSVNKAFMESLSTTQYEIAPSMQQIIVSDNAKKDHPSLKKKNSTGPEPLPRNSDVFARLQSSAHCLYPEKSQWRERLVVTLRAWAQENDAYELIQFCDLYGIDRKTLYSYRDQYEAVRDALEAAKLTIAARKRIGALTRQFAEGPAYRDQHWLDPEQDLVNQYHAELKRNTAPAPAGFTINVNAAPETGIMTSEEKRSLLESNQSSRSHVRVTSD